VRIQSVDDAIAESLGLGTARGALVAGVDDKGPAKPAGLMPGDVIVTFDGKDIKESRDLPRLVASMAVGKEVQLVIVRKGQQITKTVTLGRLEDGEKSAVASADAQGDTAPKPDAVTSALGLQLAPIDDAARKSFKLKDSIKGVVVESVTPGSAASDKGLRAGEVIEEVNQQAVETPGDIAKAIATLKSAGKKSALLLVASGAGDVRFIALPLD
jgi:serine protease Do